MELLHKFLSLDCFNLVGKVVELSITWHELKQVSIFFAYVLNWHFLYFYYFLHFL